MDVFFFHYLFLFTLCSLLSGAVVSVPQAAPYMLSAPCSPLFRITLRRWLFPQLNDPLHHFPHLISFVLVKLGGILLRPDDVCGGKNKKVGFIPTLPFGFE